MALNFPSSPSSGQVFTSTGLKPYVWNATRGAWQKKFGTAMAKNRLVNPSFQVSQENGSTGGTTNGYYPADQWFIAKSAGITASSAGSARVTAITNIPSGSQYSLTLTASGAQASLGVNDYFALVQKVEGSRIADLNYGTVNPVPIVLRIGVYTSANQPLGVTIRNAAATASYSVLINTVGGTPTYFTFPISGLPGGVWPYDSAAAMELWITYAAGTNMINTSNGQWNLNGCVAPIGVNTSIPGGITYWIFDCGIYADPYSTGIAPPFQQNHIEDDLRDCLRYFYKAFALTGVVTAATSAARLASNHPVPMRVTPAVALVGSLRCHDATSAATLSAISNVATDAQHVEITGTGTGWTIGRAVGILADGQESSYIWVGARM